MPAIADRMMKLAVLADGKVGGAITDHLIRRYPNDLAVVVATSENEIYRCAAAAGVRAVVFSSDAETAKMIVECDIDLGILAWWPRIIGRSLLELPRRGFVNTHPSLLPFNRGKHYNFWAIVEEAPFGVTLHYVTTEVDSGDIIAQREIRYGWEDNGGSLYAKAQDEMVRLFEEAYPLLRSGSVRGTPQDKRAGSFHRAAELHEASRIDLDMAYTGRELLNLLRARTFPGHPACWFKDDEEKYEVRVEIRRVKE